MRDVMFASRALALALLASAPLVAQVGTLDLLDGETLYDGGWLATWGIEATRRDTVRNGRDEVASAPGVREDFVESTLALHYGLRHDLQVGVLLPYRDLERATPAGDVGSTGIGDVEVFGKWRFYRWDAPHKALNIALIGGVTLPTGADDATDTNGARVEPELQVGGGSFDPSLGLGATYEPGRWRFNAAALQTFSLDTDDDGAAPGDRFVAELAVGNRFWLEPYPGPFMRLDATLRYYRDGRDVVADAPLTDSGGQRVAFGLNLAFRPQPAIDLQLMAELPLWQDVHGTQLADDHSLGFTFGYRY